jgi:hypothetical protein
MAERNPSLQILVQPQKLEIHRCAAFAEKRVVREGVLNPGNCSERGADYEALLGYG